MAFRTEEIKAYKTTVICDGCKKEAILCETSTPASFDTRMNMALAKGYTFKDSGKQFENYCIDCKSKYQ